MSEVNTKLLVPFNLALDVWPRRVGDLTLWDCEAALDGETIGAVANRKSKQAAIEACKKEAKITLKCVINNWSQGKYTL